MKKLTPKRIIQGVRNRGSRYLLEKRAYRHYQNVDYRHQDASILPGALRDMDLLAKLQERFSSMPIAEYFSALRGELQADPGLWEKQRYHTEEALAGRLVVYDHKVDLGAPVEWNIDITGNGVWPRLFFKHYRKLTRNPKSGRGDFRFTWELNRQQHLVAMAVAYGVDSKPEYAQQIVAHILTWIERNPPFHSMNWSSAMEFGLRLVTWCLCLAMIPGSLVQQEDQRRILVSIYQQFRYLCENLSVNLSDAGKDTKLKNNHTIVELASLLVALEFLPELSAEGYTIEALTAELKNELDRQTYADGMQVEQASSYLRFVQESLLVARLVVAGSEALDPYIDNYARALDAFRVDEHNIFVVGDEDNGHVLLPCYESLPESLKVVDGLYATLHATGIVPEKSASPGVRDWRDLGQETSLLEQSGHCVLRGAVDDSPLSVYFRAGNMDFPTIPGYAPHAHADLLSFALAVGGLHWFVDRGTYSYTLRDISFELRSSVAHNTLLVDGFDQMRIIGPFHSDRHARARIIEQVDRRVKGEMLLSAGERTVSLTREISVSDNGKEILFHDVISGLAGEKVTWLFNLHPDVKRDEAGVLTRDDSAHRLKMDGLDRMELHPVKYSPRYGVLQDSLQLRYVEEAGDASTLQRKWSIAIGSD